MPEDIVPGLLTGILEDYREKCIRDERLQELVTVLKNGTATYKEANEYAEITGRYMKESMDGHMSSNTLPDGKCYFNIGNRVIPGSEHELYKDVAGYTKDVQTSLNKKAGIGIKAIVPEEQTGRVKSMVNKAAAADQYDDVAHETSNFVKSLAREHVDRSVKQNAEFQAKSGLQPKIIRKSSSKCCDWCSGLEGEYKYPDVPKDVYARHNNCTCDVEYDPGSGKRQNVHSKKWESEEEIQRREELKALGLDTSDKNVKIEHRKTIGTKRDQLDTGYPGRIPDDKLDEYNEKALKQIIIDTGYTEEKAKAFQQALIQYFGGDYETIELSPDSNITKIMIDGLEKMPKYNGTISRGLLFNPDLEEHKPLIEQFDRLKPGDTLPNKGVIESWTSDKRTSQSYASIIHPGNSIIISCDKNESGVGVQHISKFGKQEAEVTVINPNFEIIEIVRENKYDYLKKNLEKLSSNDKFFAECYLEDGDRGEMICWIKVKEKN